MSYHASYVGSVSLEKLSNEQLTNLAQKTASQIEQQLLNIYKDLDLLANYPFIQQAFIQFNQGQRLETVEEKLFRYKTQNPLYARISLITLAGQHVLTLPYYPDSQMENAIDSRLLLKARDVDTFTSGVLLDHPDGPLIVFIKKVFDFEDFSKPVGHLFFYVNLNSLSNYAEELHPVPGATGFVFDHNLKSVITKNKLPEKLNLLTLFPSGIISRNQRIKLDQFRLYLSHVPLLNWSIGLILSEQALLGDITELERRSLMFSIGVSIMALLVTLYFVRRITNPIAQLIQGAQEFSKGNLEQRIEIRGEGELRRLGEEFNAMASELKSRERQVIQVDRLASLGIMAAGIAHEVRNPLAGMKSCAQLMQRKAISEEVGSLAQGINVEIERLDQIVKQLLDYAKPGKASLQPILLDDVVEETLNIVDKSLIKMNITTTTDLRGTPPVMTDAGHVQQILLNLILNAAQSMPDGGQIKITSSVDNQRVSMKVIDTGCGIAPNHLDRIFDPFFTTRPNGTGLGLSVVHSLMKQLNIDWHISSRVEQGTTFELLFPTSHNKDYPNGEHLNC